MDQLEHLFNATVQGFETSLYEHMPLSVYRNFNVWALSQKNAYVKIWLQIVGIPQFAKLTHNLLNDTVAADNWAKLVDFTCIINSYLIYETISDNLAFGLAAQRPDDDTYHLRRKILIDFNNAMVARMKGDRAGSDIILARMEADAVQVSGFTHSITGSEQQTIAGSFFSQYPGHVPTEIEFGTWNSLVANIQSCADMVDHMQSYQLGDFLRQGLIRRYEAVNDLLLDNVQDRESLIRVSINTILVVPVLTYYISAISEALEPNPALAEVIENGTLLAALEDAALMVRLLNDLGTNLVATDQYHTTLLNDLYAQLPPSVDPDTTFADILMAHSTQAPLMTRIRKDISFAEFNVSLHNLMTSPPTTTSLLLFGSNLVYFQNRYRQCRERLHENLNIIRQTLKSDTVSKLVYRFVGFHEHIYKNQFDDQSGDYATKPDNQSVAN